MSNLYRYGFWILLITLVTFFNLWNFKNKGFEADNRKCKEVNNKRISSLFVSNSISKRQIGVINGKNIITTKQSFNLLKDSTLVILLVEPKCNKCQEKELVRLNNLRQKEEIKVIGITTKLKIKDVAIQRKINGIKFPIYWVDDTIFFNDLAFNKEFPQVLYIVNGIVVSAFKPIPKDDEFSKKYYKALFSKNVN